MDFNFSDLGIEGLEEVSKTVGVYQVYLKGSKFNVEVHQESDGSYMGVSDCMILSPKNACPYRSLRNFETITEALKDAILGIKSYMSVGPDYYFLVRENPYTKEESYQDGNGEFLNYHEVRQRLKEYRGIDV